MTAGHCIKNKQLNNLNVTLGGHLGRGLLHHDYDDKVDDEDYGDGAGDMRTYRYRLEP